MAKQSEIKGLIGGLNVQQSEIMAKQKLVDVIGNEVSRQVSNQKGIVGTFNEVEVSEVLWR